MLDIVAVGPLQGYHQSPGAGGLAFCTHTFRASPDGQLEHLTDGKLRATVPPEGWKGYLEHWPEAQSVIDGLALKPSAAAIVDPGIERQQAVSNRKKKPGQGRVAGSRKRGARG